MPKISDDQREAKRQLILEAAMRCFSRDGFHAATTPDIAREAGLSQGTLYLYFPTKDDMVVALADDRHRSEAFLNALATSEPDPIQGLLLLFELYGKGLTDPDRIEMRRLGIQGWAEALRNPRIHASAVEGLSQVRLAIVALIARGQSTGQMRSDIDADCMARTLIAFFQGLVLQAAWGEPIDLEGCGQLMRRMIATTFLLPENRP